MVQSAPGDIVEVLWPGFQDDVLVDGIVGGRHGVDGGFIQNRRLAVELAAHDPIYEDMVLKFAEHFLYIAAAMNHPGQDGMWDEEDGFYYDILRLPDGSAQRLKVRSMVGLLPLCATTVIEAWQRERIPRALALFKNACGGYRNFGRLCTLRAGGISAWPSGGSLPWSTRSGSAGS